LKFIERILSNKVCCSSVGCSGIKNSTESEMARKRNNTKKEKEKKKKSD
jgi:hypothetical protein